MLRRLCIVALLILVFCAIIGHSTGGEDTEEAIPPTTYKLEEVSFMLERGFCHGECPVYSVEVLGDGTVFYIGERHVHVEGQKSGFISREQVLELLDAFYEVGFSGLNGGYLSKHKAEMDGDGQVSVLLFVTKGTPRTVVTLRIGDYSKQVSYQSKYAPKELIDLAAFMDEVVDSRQWISKEAEGRD
jgi:hypothetical protein